MHRKDNQAGALLLLFCAYLVLSPFYFFRSGSPQVADLFGACLIGLYLLNSCKNVPTKTLSGTSSSLSLLYLFFVYSTLVSLTNSMLNGDETLLLSSIFFSYNIFIFTFVATYFSNRLGSPSVFNLVRGATIICLFVQIIASFVLSRPENGRSVIFFNNPNQLGYFSVCILSIYCLLTSMSIRRAYINEKILGFLVIGGCLYLAFLSLSKAAIVSIAVIVLYRSWRSPFTWLLCTIVLLFGLSNLNEIELAAKVFDRISGIGTQSDDNFSARGYDRIVNHPEYLLWGAGEGLTNRFISQIGHYEIHSSWGTLLFSYGIMGFFLFSCFLFTLVWRAPIFVIMYLFPLFLYGITHQGLRFTLFWIALAFALVCSNHEKINRRNLDEQACS